MTKLLLVRHGKAKQDSHDGKDRSRELTEAGRRALAASLPHELLLAGDLSDALIVTSPADRARDTARLIADCIGFDKGKREKRIMTLDALYDQDIDAVLHALEGLDPKKASTVIVVGHSPFMEDFLKRLCGAQVGFGKGAIAAVDIDLIAGAKGDAAACGEAAESDEQAAAESGESAVAGNDEPVGDEAANGGVADVEATTDEPAGNEAAVGEAAGNEAAVGEAAGAVADQLAGDVANGELAWFVQGPDDALWRTLVRMERVVADKANEVGKCMDAYLAQPDDPENLHAFRVSLRTLRSLLAFTAPYRRHRDADDVSGKLRDVMMETSHLRELDMLGELVAQRYGSQSALHSLCRSRRYAESERLIRFIDENDQEIVKLIKRAGKVEWKRAIEKNGLSGASLGTDIAALTTRVLDRGRKCDLIDAEATHTFRKKVKEVCYVGSEFSDIAGEYADKVRLVDARSGDVRLVDMKQLKDDLGALCDARVNRDIAARWSAEPLDQLSADQLAEFDAAQQVTIDELVKVIADELGVILKQRKADDEGAGAASSAGAETTADAQSDAQSGDASGEEASTGAGDGAGA